MIASRTMSKPSSEGRWRPFVTLWRSTRRSLTNTAYGKVRVPLPRRLRARRGDLAFEGTEQTIEGTEQTIEVAGTSPATTQREGGCSNLTEIGSSPRLA